MKITIEVAENGFVVTTMDLKVDPPIAMSIHKSIDSVVAKIQSIFAVRLEE